MRPRLVGGAMPSRCLLVRLGDRHLLVDTGIGLADIADPRRRLGAAWVFATRPRLDPARTAVRQVQARGLDVSDVTDVVLTHMDLDHAGGIGDFPLARVHVSAVELEVANASPARRGPQGSRYSPAQWRDSDLRPHAADGTTWQGIAGCSTLPGFDGRVVLVPLPGHSAGHCGVAIRTGTEAWILHVGDAVFEHPDHPAPAALRAFERLVMVDRAAAAASVASVHALGSHIAVVPSHPRWILPVPAHVP